MMNTRFEPCLDASENVSISILEPVSPGNEQEYYREIVAVVQLDRPQIGCGGGFL